MVTSASTPVFTINASPFVMREFSLDMGNELVNRFLVGSEAVLIGDRTDQIAAKVEAKALTALNPYALAQSAALLPAEIQHGTVAGRISTFKVPRAQMQRPTGLENQNNILEWPLAMIAQPNVGDDQWTLALT